MTKVVVTDVALREMVREALNGTGWSNEEAGDVNVNPVVDPSATVTDPVNPDFTPQTKTEFGIAVNQLVKNLPDGDMPAVFVTVKKALDQKTEKEEISDAEQAALAGGSQEAIDDAQDEKKHEGTHMDNKQLEEMLRGQIRQALAEAPDPADVVADEDPEEPVDAEGKPKKRTKAYKPGALGGMADVGGASFEEIAKETGMSVAGAKQLVDKSLEKMKFLWKLDADEELDILVLTAANDYISYLAKTGELTAPDIQLMKDHPTIVTELDGYREFLHNYVRKARKEGQKLSTFGEARYEPGAQIKMKSVSGEHPKAAVPGEKKPETTKAKTASGKDAQVDWSGLAEEDEMDEADAATKHPVPGQQIKMKSLSGEHPKAVLPGEKSPSVTKMKTASGKDAEIDWSGVTEGKLTEAAYLTEAVSDAVYQDKRGPYLVYEGLEVRPQDPNRTQYKAGQRVTVKNSGMRNGCLVAVMPNGELWKSEARKPSKKALTEAKETMLLSVAPSVEVAQELARHMSSQLAGEDIQFDVKGRRVFYTSETSPLPSGGVLAGVPGMNQALTAFYASRKRKR